MARVQTARTERLSSTCPFLQMHSELNEHTAVGVLKAITQTGLESFESPASKTTPCFGKCPYICPALAGL